VDVPAQYALGNYMSEALHMFLTLGAVLVISLGLLALIVRFILSPLMALLAIPTYAAMIALEYFIAHQICKPCPKPLQLKRPSTFWKKLCMDFFAGLCTISSLEIGAKIFSGFFDRKLPSENLNYFLLHADDKAQFLSVALFWLLLSLTYITSYWHGDGPDHPINKLEDLVVPDWVKKIIGKATG